MPLSATLICHVCKIRSSLFCSRCHIVCTDVCSRETCTLCSALAYIHMFSCILIDKIRSHMHACLARSLSFYGNGFCHVACDHQMGDGLIVLYVLQVEWVNQCLRRVGIYTVLQSKLTSKTVAPTPKAPTTPQPFNLSQPRAKVRPEVKLPAAVPASKPIPSTTYTTPIEVW